MYFYYMCLVSDFFFLHILYCGPWKHIDWKATFYSSCYFLVLLFIEFLNHFFALQYTLECHYSNPTFADLATRHMLVPICRFIFLHLLYTDWKIRFHSACYLLMVLFIDFLNSSLLYSRLYASITASKAFPGLSICRRLVPIFGFMLFVLDMYWLENQILQRLLFSADVY